MNNEFEVRHESLKKATIVMNTLAESFYDESLKAETKSLVWSISWAVVELVQYRNEISALKAQIDFLDEELKR